MAAAAAAGSLSSASHQPRPLHALPPEVVQACRMHVPLAYEALLHCDGLYLSALARLDAKEGELSRCIEVGQEVLLQLNTMRQRCSELSDEKEELRSELMASEQLVAHLREVIRTRDRQLEDVCNNGNNHRRSNSPPIRSASTASSVSSSGNDGNVSHVAMQARVTALRAEVDRAVERILELEGLLEKEVRARQSSERQARSAHEEAVRAAKDLQSVEDSTAELRRQVTELTATRTQESLDICSCGVILANMLNVGSSAQTPSTVQQLKTALTQVFNVHQHQQQQLASYDRELHAARAAAAELEAENSALQTRLAAAAVSAAKQQRHQGQRSESPRSRQGGVGSEALEKQLEDARRTIEQLRAAQSSTGVVDVPAETPRKQQQATAPATPRETAVRQHVKELESALLDARHRIAMLEVTNQQLREEGMRIEKNATTTAAAAPSSAASPSPVLRGRASATAGLGDVSVDELLSTVAAQRDEIIEVHSVVKRLTERLRDCDATLESAKASKAALESELRRAKDEVAAKLHERDAEMRRLTVDNEAKREQLRDLQAQMTAMRDVLATVPERHREAQEKVAQSAQLKGELRAVEEELARRTRELQALQARFDEYRAAHDVSSERHRDVLSQLQSQAEELHAARAALRAAEDSAAASRMQIESRCRELTRDMASLGAAARRALAQIAAVEQECEQVEYTSLVRVVQQLIAGIREPLATNVALTKMAFEDGNASNLNNSTPSAAVVIDTSNVKSLMAQLRDSENNLAVSVSRCRQLEHELASCRTDLEAAERECGKLRARLDKSTAEVNTTLDDVEKWRADASKLRSRIHELEAAKTDVEAELKRSVANAERAEQRLGEADEQLAGQRRELERRAEAIRTLQEQLKTATAQHHEQQQRQQQQLQQHQHQMSMQQQLQQQKPVAPQPPPPSAHIADELDRLSRAHVTLTAELRAVKDERDAAREKLAHADGRCAALQHRCDELSNALNAARREVVSIHAELQEIADDDEAQLRSRDDELRAAQQTIAALERRLQDAQNTSGEMAHTRSALNGELQSLRREVATLRDRNSALEAEQLTNESLRQKIEYLTVEVAQLTEAANIDARAFDALRRTNATLEERLQVVERDRDGLRAAAPMRSVSVESSRLIT